jgi:hypothetical protein
LEWGSVGVLHRGVDAGTVVKEVPGHAALPAVALLPEADEQSGYLPAGVADGIGERRPEGDRTLDRLDDR